MQVIVRGTNIAVTPGLSQYAERKVRRLARLVSDSAKAEVIQHVQRELQVAEVVLQTDRFTLRAKERTTDMYASIDAAIDKIERQLKRLKDKRSPAHREQAQARRQPGASVSTSEEEEAEERESLPRRSLFTKPMAEEEAVLQINALGEEIFIFHNTSTNQVNVLHRLADGSLELIEPETG